MASTEDIGGPTSCAFAARTANRGQCSSCTSHGKDSVAISFLWSGGRPSSHDTRVHCMTSVRLVQMIKAMKTTTPLHFFSARFRELGKTFRFRYAWNDTVWC